jgi:Co/Zn/Cd efflux system component
MSDWSWPQFVVLLVVLIGAVESCYKAFKNPRMTSGGVTIVAFIVVAYYTFYAYVLHVGGFW